MDKLFKQKEPEKIIIEILSSILIFPFLKLDSRKHSLLSMFDFSFQYSLNVVIKNLKTYSTSS